MSEKPAHRPNAPIHGLYAEWEREETARREQSERLKALFVAAKANNLNPKALRVAFKERYRIAHQTPDQAAKASELSDEVELYLITLAGVGAPARTREAAEEITSNASNSGALRAETAQEEITPDHDPETGEITEPAKPASSGVAAVETEAPSSVDSGDAPPSVAATIQVGEANVAEREGSEVRPAGDEGNSGRGDREDQRRDAGAAAERAEPEGDHRPAAGGDEVATAGHQVGAGLAGPTEGLVLPVAAPIPGTVWTERTPPRPVHWHEYCKAWPDLWGPQLAALTDDIRENGVKDAIVKIGDAILSGRARYNIARTLIIDYPVTEYAGTDPLADSIRWNLEARPELSQGQRKGIADKLIKIEPDRAADIAELFGLHVEEVRKARQA